MNGVIIFNGKSDEVTKITIKNFINEDERDIFIKKMNNKYSSDEKYWEMAFDLNEDTHIINEFELYRSDLEQFID